MASIDKRFPLSAVTPSLEERSSVSLSISSSQSSGESTIETHAEASAPNSEPNCIVRCFINIKNQIVRFFKWICCFCNTSKVEDKGYLKNLEDEIAKIGKHYEEAEKQVKQDANNPGVDAHERDENILTRDCWKSALERVKQKLAIFKRYNDTATEEEAMVYLHDLIKIVAIVQPREAAFSALMENTQKQTRRPQDLRNQLTRVQYYEKLINDNLETYKSPKERDLDERSIKGWIKSLEHQGELGFLSEHPVYKDLLNFVDKIRKELGLEPIVVAES